MNKTSVWGFVKAFFLNGGMKGCAEYVLDVANSWVSSLADGTKANISTVLEVVTKCLGYLKKFEQYIPEQWKKYYAPCVTTLSTVVDALSDLKLETAELTSIAQQFQIAYAAYKAD